MLAERYLELALRLAKLEPAWVEAYTGPESLRARVEDEPAPTPAALREQVAELLPEAGPWLRAQLAGIDVALRLLAGEPFAYAELVERCHGVRPELEPEETFAAAHLRLGEALPGEGDVAARYRSWLETQRVAPEALLRGLEALAAELRERTRQTFGLPAGEQAELELVSGERWAAFSRPLSGLRSRISINTDLPIASWRLLELAAHEIYPGHHTENATKDVYPEFHVHVSSTPQPLVAEGIAQLGLEVLVGGEAEELGAARLRPLGIAYDAAGAGAVRAAKEKLNAIPHNILLLGLEGDEARAYARRWMLDDDAFVDKAISSLSAQPWRPYISCYPEGLKLCRRFVGGDRERFARLLRELVTPEELAAS